MLIGAPEFYEKASEALIDSALRMPRKLISFCKKLLRDS
jgi:hypothetical protein